MRTALHFSNISSGNPTWSALPTVNDHGDQMGIRASRWVLSIQTQSLVSTCCMSATPLSSDGILIVHGYRIESDKKGAHHKVLMAPQPTKELGFPASQLPTSKPPSFNHNRARHIASGSGLFASPRKSHPELRSVVYRPPFRMTNRTCVNVHPAIPGSHTMLSRILPA